MCALFPHEHFALDTIGFITVANDEKENTFLGSLFLQTILNVHFPHVFFYKQTSFHDQGEQYSVYTMCCSLSMPNTQTDTVPICNPRSLPETVHGRTTEAWMTDQTTWRGIWYTWTHWRRIWCWGTLTVLLHERGCCVWFSLVGRSRGNTKLYLSYVSC